MGYGSRFRQASTQNIGADITYKKDPTLAKWFLFLDQRSQEKSNREWIPRKVK